MNTFLIIILILTALIIILCRLYISVNISYSKNDDKDLFVFSISMLKFLKLYTYEFSPAHLDYNDILVSEKPKKESLEKSETQPQTTTSQEQKKQKKQNPFSTIKKATNYYIDNLKDKINVNKAQLKKYFNIAKKFLKTAKLEKLNLKLTYGFEDAALTGTSAGILAVLKEFLLITLQRKFRNIDQIHLFVFPKFGQEDYLEVDFDCIFKVRVGNVITIMANILANMALSGRR
ncbi:DUF2953 domain-containing protein [Selenomonadales bacterium OttesenSCG-928-I06]|nr:DUF2953 domain-containing protein [Selenomonadales bacterium OttesenSCG-928-I06]